MRMTLYLFLENDIEGARNLKLVLGAFKKLSGSKINFHKSELLCFRVAREWSKKFVELFGCREGNLPFWYLEIPVHFLNYQIRIGMK